MADVGRPVVQRRDQPLASAWNGKHAEIQAFADEIAFALRNQERQRKDAAQRRIGLTVAERDCLGGGALTGAKAKQCRDDGTHELSLHAGRLRQGPASRSWAITSPIASARIPDRGMAMRPAP